MYHMNCMYHMYNAYKDENENKRSVYQMYHTKMRMRMGEEMCVPHVAAASHRRVGGGLGSGI